MINKIAESIQKMVEDTTINLNTIKMHPVDINILREGIALFGLKRDRKIQTVLGLKIIEDLDVKIGTALVYNDKFVIEIQK